MIAAAIYPSGTGAASIVGNSVRVRRGWVVGGPPTEPGTLNADLAAGILNVTVFSEPNVTRKTTRYPRRWQLQGARTTPTLAWTIAGQTATLSGTVTAPQNVVLIANGVAASHAVQSNDTLATIAANIANALSAYFADGSGSGFEDSSGDSFSESSTIAVSGATITFSGAYSLIGRTGALDTVIQEVRRQEQDIMVSCWCPDQATRDALAAAVDETLAPINFLKLADGSAARITYRRTRSSDKAENENLYRRDVTYTVEYATTVIMTAAQLILAKSTIQGSSLPIAAQTAATSLIITTET